MSRTFTPLKTVRRPSADCDHSNHIHATLDEVLLKCLVCGEVMGQGIFWGSNDKENWHKIGVCRSTEQYPWVGIRDKDKKTPYRYYWGHVNASKRPHTLERPDLPKSFSLYGLDLTTGKWVLVNTKPDRQPEKG